MHQQSISLSKIIADNNQAFESRTFRNSYAQHYLSFQNKEIKDQSFLSKYFSCCKKNSKVSDCFKEAFRSMNEQEKKEYFEKNIKYTHKILMSRETLVDYSQLEEKEEQIIECILYIKEQGFIENWQPFSVKIDKLNKIIVVNSLKKQIALKSYLLRRSKDTHKKALVLEPLEPRLERIRLSNGPNISQQNFNNLMNKMMDECMNQNLIDLLQSQQKICHQPLSQIKLKMQISLSQTATLLRKSTIFEKIRSRQIASYNLYNYKHLVNPLQKSQTIMLPHQLTFIQTDWKSTSDGELIGINEEKLRIQNSVMKLIIKRIINSGKIMHISLPVQVFGRDTDLSRACSSYKCAPLFLEKASVLKDSLERFKQIIAFSFTSPVNFVDMNKSFNPILGQTYQAIANGTLFYGQQISHHPPSSAIFVKGRGYTVYGTFRPVVQFSFNNVAGSNAGWVKISFDENDFTKKIVKFTNPVGNMSGLIIGDRKLTLSKSTFIVDEQNLLFCKIEFGKGKDKSRKDYKCEDCIQGKIVKLKSTEALAHLEMITQKDIQIEYGMIHGRWTKQVYYQNQLVIDIRSQAALLIESYPSLLLSDYSFRKDLILRAEQLMEQAQDAKDQLQNLQRKDEELRKKRRKTLS